MRKSPFAPAPKKTKNTNKTSPKTAPKADPGPPTGLTPTQVAVLQGLSERSGMSTAEVSAAAVIGHSTAQKALTVLEAAGLARREAGVRNGALKSPDRWFASTPTTSTDPEPAQDAPQTATDTDTPEDGTTAEDVVEQVESEPDSHNGAAEPAGLVAAVPLTVSAGQGPDTPEDSATAELDEAAADPDHVDDAVTDSVDATNATDGIQRTASADDSDTVPSPKADSADTTQALPGAADVGTSLVEAAPTRQSRPPLGKGELRAMVEQYLRDHSEQAWTSSKIAKALGRSAGAVNNAAMKLVENGAAITFDDAPRRFQIVPAPAGKPTRRTTKTALRPAA